MNPIATNKNTKKDYSNLSKEDLIKIVEKLESRKKYGLIWDEDKVKEQFEKDAENALPVLKEVKGKEITDKDDTKPVNILIEGDNYHALSVLNFTHQGKVDVIYIDPPYNTGNKDFQYNDTYVDVEDTFRHSKWLSFMYKRLVLSKNLLSEDGLIFISIDDNEQAQLKLLCNEIFGEENFIAQLVWKKKYTGGQHARHYVDMHEYIFVFAKNKNMIGPILIDRPDEQKEKFNLEDKYVAERGKYYLRPLKSNLEERKTLVYPIKTPDGKSVTTQWLVAKDTFEQMVLDGRIEFVKKRDGTYQISKKYYENDSGGLIKVQSLILDFPNTEAKFELKKLFDIQEGRDNVLYTVKPLNLIKYIIRPISKKDSIVLDFFAGSGTTGHAVMELNKEDGGSRSFILCTNDEGNIASDICYPRIKKVMGGYTKTEGIGGSLKYFKTKFIKKTANKDDLKIRMTKECTEMLCLREGIFDEIKTTEDYRIFQKGNKVLAAYYSLDRKALSELKKELSKIEGEKILYCFTLDPLGLNKKDFNGWKDVTVEPIPQKILDVYKQIYEY